MLKIVTTNRENTESLRVQLHGRFTGEYLLELEKALSVESDSIGKVVLDLSNVTFVDRAAMKFLCDAKSRNFVLENLPFYVTRWIEQEGCGGSAHLEPPKSSPPIAIPRKNS